MIFYVTVTFGKDKVTKYIAPASATTKQEAAFEVGRVWANDFTGKQLVSITVEVNSDSALTTLREENARLEQELPKTQPVAAYEPQRGICRPI
jgi:hypothetical protein